ncbi:MAG: nickel pincer cofactor biosynthesis protein LarB [Cyanobacteria bacterium J06642_2]
MNAEQVRTLLEAVAAGKIDPDSALDTLQFSPFEAVGDFAHIDHHRALRNGFPETIWGEGKTPDQIAQLMQTLRDRGFLAMATRVTATAFAAIQAQLPDVQYAETARICFIPAADTPSHPGELSIITAGTADLPVAEEAAITAELCGFKVRRLWDVGVAGIHRLLSNRDAISEADAIVVVAGMEGALASIVAGLADCPVVAVPTSIGYGASFGGVAALLTMLNSCAAGVGVVNIDNGYGAAILAGHILRTANRLSHKTEPLC